MKIIKNVRASEVQEQVTYYNNEAHVLLNERVVEVVSEDATTTTTTQYEYDKVVVENANLYADLVAIAELEFAVQYLEETDYINNKYNDEVILMGSMTKTEFKAKYDGVCAKRSAARIKIAELRG